MQRSSRLGQTRRVSSRTHGHRLHHHGKTSSTDLYERLARYCDEQISKAVLGQTLTSDSGGGSYAQSKTHNEVRHDLTVADCKALASTLRRDLIRRCASSTSARTSASQSCALTARSRKT